MAGLRKVERQFQLKRTSGVWIGTCKDFPSILVSGPTFEDVKTRTIQQINEMSFENYITPEYKALQTAMHEKSIDYGMSARAYITPVLELIKLHDFKTVLDYGCGKGTLRALIFGREGIEIASRVKEYDPAIPGMDGLPEPAEFVVCIDVLEHIEPGKIYSVLDHMQWLARKMVFLTVALVPATKTLADGRNAHLLIMSQDWWLDEMQLGRWDMRAFSGTDTGFVFIGVPR